MAVRETVHNYVVHQSYHKIPKVSAGAYIIFSKARFDGIIFGGGYVWREICVTKVARLILGREICVSKSIGLPYSWKEIYVSNFARSFS